MGRLRALLKKLNENKELLEAYDDIISKQIQEGVVEDIPSQRELQGPVVHYIPHHAVVVLEKSTPVRVVMDAKATVGRTKSLNDNILKGTKWLGNTIGSLVRFRKFKNAVTSDVRHAFHQISVAPKDRDAVRFIWVHDVSKPPVGENIRILRFTRVAFGIVASPFLLYATIQHHLKTHPTKFNDIISRNMYADNLLTSLPAEIDATEFYKTTKKLFSDMAMNITKWKTNIPELKDVIPPEDALSEEEISVLGLAWETLPDSLGLRTPKIANLLNIKPTKRIILKIMASIFDPLGWVTPFTLWIRKLLRKLWTEKLQWDTPLEGPNLENWLQIVAEINEVQTVKLNRMFFTSEINEHTDEYELHTFVDASAEAMGCVAYLRRVSHNPEVAIVMAKSRLSPPTKLSVPRLEFCALVLGVRMQNYLVASLDLKEETKRYIWSDSKCVLAWISSNKLLPVAVEKHLTEIHNSKVTQFRYVPTDMNPADVASRGALLSDLKTTSWFQGPVWLSLSENWPPHTNVTCENTELEQPEKVLFIQGQNEVNIEAPFSLQPENFSDWKSLLRRTAYCIWLLHFKLKKDFIKVKTPIDYSAARMLWLRWDQRRNGSDQSQILQKISHFKNVEVFHDQNGILRCRSRMGNSNLPWDAVEPVVLVKKSHITKLIILDIHQRNYHVGTAHTLATLRKSYWLVHGRREVYRIIHSDCFKCKRYQAKPYTLPKEGPLPEFRIQQTSHPFQNVGIDVFGPAYVVLNRGQDETKLKRWVLLFTCLVVRAIHFEVLEGMDTQDILCAIKRFVARRGTPELILSDNAPQFHLVNGCIQELWYKFSEDTAANKYLAEKEIVWKFTPQNAPWMGGAYERLVQITKNAFKRTYGEQTLTDREFCTNITELEGILNNRPITYSDRELTTPLLTPNHFLHVQYPALPIDTEKPDDQRLSTKNTLLQYWKASETSLNVFWKVWSEQYLLALREVKSKSGQTQTLIPKVGEIVLLLDPNKKRGHWRKAIIERLITSADGKVRSAQIRLPTGIKMIRPITKLASLEVTENLPDQVLQASASASVENVEVPSTEIIESRPILEVAPAKASATS